MDSADYAKQATITWDEWVTRVRARKYTATTIKNTSWYKAGSALEVEAHAPPPPIDPPPVVIVPPPALSYESAVDWPDEFAPVRRLTFTDKNGLLNLLNGRQPGDLIRYVGAGDLLLDTTNDSFRGYCVRTPGDVRVELGHPNEAHVHHRFTGLTAYAAVLLAGTSHMHIRGGEVSTPNGGGAGIAVRGGYDGITDHLSWEDFYSHDCGADGMCIFPNHPGTGALSEVSDFSFKGVVKRIAQNLAWDPHIDKGTGIHCCNTLDVASGRLLRGRLAIDGYDSLCGSVIECGSPSSAQSVFDQVTYYFRGTRLKLVPTSQTAGNGLQFWGGVPIKLTVGWSELIDSTGSVIHGYGTKGSGWDSGHIVVEHGRHQNVNQSSAHDNIAEPYDSRFNIIYQDCL